MTPTFAVTFGIINNKLRQIVIRRTIYIKPFSETFCPTYLSALSASPIINRCLTDYLPFGQPVVFSFYKWAISVGDQQQRTPMRFSQRHLSFEKLEDRYVFDHSGLGIEVDLGTVIDGVVSDEITVTGLPEEVTGAEAISLSRSSHVFIYGEERASSTDIFARVTTADGQPGEPGKLLRSIPTSSMELIGFDATGIENDQFVLTWHEQNAVRAQIFDSNLDPISDVIDIDLFQEYFGSETGGYNELLDVYQKTDGELVFAYVDPGNDSVNLQGFNSTLTAETSLKFTSEPGQSAFNLTIDQLADESLQLSWVAHDFSDFQEWTIQTVSFDGLTVANDESLLVSGFFDAPDFEHQSDGKLIVSGARLLNGHLTTVIDTYDSNQTLVNSFQFGDSILPIQGTSRLAVGADDSYSLMILDEFATETIALLSTFNADGELIGISQQLNQSELFPLPKGTLVALDDGGYASYWVGLALNETSPALFSRTISYEQTELDLEIVNPSANFDLQNYVVEITGIPEDAGLNIGQRTTANRWIVSAAELDEVRLLTFEERHSLNLTFRLLPITNPMSLAETSITIGSDDDDVLIPSNGIQSILGSTGFDTLVLNSDIDEYVVEEISQSQFRLTNTSNATEFFFKDLEQFQVDGQLFSLQEFLNETTSENESTIVVPVTTAASPLTSNAEVNETPTPPNSQGPIQLPSSTTVVESQAEQAEDPIRLDANKSNEEEFGNAATENVEQEKQDTSAEKNKERSVDKGFLVEPQLHVTGGQQTSPSDQLSGNPDQNTPQSEGDLRSNLSPSVAHAHQPLATQPVELKSKMTDLVRSNVESDSVITPARIQTIDASTVAPAFDNQALFEAIDKVEQELVDDSATSEIIVGAGVVVATGYSLAQIAWLLRSSAVLTKLMSSIPIWVSFDPLPLLNKTGSQTVNPTVNESLVDIVSSNS